MELWLDPASRLIVDEVREILGDVASGRGERPPQSDGGEEEEERADLETIIVGVHPRTPVGHELHKLLHHVGEGPHNEEIEAHAPLGGERAAQPIEEDRDEEQGEEDHRDADHGTLNGRDVPDCQHRPPPLDVHCILAAQLLQCLQIHPRVAITQVVGLKVQDVNEGQHHLRVHR